MKSATLRYVVIIGSLVSATPSMANTIYDLTATSLSPASVTGFTIEFDDLNNDGKLSSTAEITSFSGVTPIGGLTYTSVDGIANTAFSNGSGGSFWDFSVGSHVLVSSASFWSYSLTQANAVPGPIAGAGLPGLLAVGAAFIAWKRRRRFQSRWMT
jgi:hypothetical protein